MHEVSREVQAEAVSNGRNKIHQTKERKFSPPLAFRIKRKRKSMIFSLFNMKVRAWGTALFLPSQIDITSHQK